MSNGMSGSGVGGSGNNVGNNVMLSELPEPPISVSEIGPIPPPPMFSTPSPTMVSGRPHGPGVHMSHHEYDYDGELSFSGCSIVRIITKEINFSDDDQEELDSDEEYYSNHNIDTSRVDEIPAKEPKFNAVPLKSALKKKSSNPGTPTQDNNRTLLERQANSSFK